MCGDSVHLRGSFRALPMLDIYGKLSVATVQSAELLCCNAADIAASSALVIVFMANMPHGSTVSCRLSL